MSVVLTEPLEARVVITEDSGRIQIVRVGFMGPQGPPGTLIEVEEDGAVQVTPLSSLDFRTGFDVTEPTARTAQIDLDLSELSAGGELGGNLDAPTVDALHSGSTHQSITDALNAHEIDVVGAHDASAIAFTPFDTIVSADVQAAVVEALTDARAYTDNGHVLLSVLRGAIDGVAELDATGKVPASELPALAFGEVFVVASEGAMLALAASPGDIAVRTDTSQTFILSALPASTLANWVELLNPGGDVTSVNGRTGAVTGLEEAANKGALSGYAALDASGYVPDAQINPAIARDTEVSDAITTHTGAADPHPTYETAAEAQALVDTGVTTAESYAATQDAAHVAASDPHTQYETAAEAQALVDVHTSDATDAHDASAVSVLDAAGLYAATDVEGALAEIATRRGGGYVTLTDGATVATNAALGEVFALPGRGAHTMSNPTNPAIGQRISYIIENLGGYFATSWDTGFVLAGSWTEPPSGRARSIEFTYNGTRWIELGRTGREVRLSSGFEPTDIASVVGWWTVDDLLNLTDGAAVPTWPARAGANLVAVSGKEPTFKTAIQNGLPIVRFDGTDRYLYGANPLLGYKSCSILAVFAKASTTAALRCLADFSGTGGHALTFWEGYSISANEMRVAYGTGSVQDYNTSGTVGTAFHQWSWVGSNGAQPQLYKDAGAAIPPTLSGVLNLGAGVSQASMFMGWQNGTTRWMNGDLAELIVCSAALSDPDRATLASYLKTRWGTP